MGWFDGFARRFFAAEILIRPRITIPLGVKAGSPVDNGGKRRWANPIPVGDKSFDRSVQQGYGGCATALTGSWHIEYWRY